MKTCVTSVSPLAAPKILSLTVLRLRAFPKTVYKTHSPLGAAFGLTNGKTVNIQVTAANEAGESSPSAEVQAKIP